MTPNSLSISDLCRVIKVNEQEFPYYLGKFHKNRKMFGKLKFLFQVIGCATSKQDIDKNVYFPIKNLMI